MLVSKTFVVFFFLCFVHNCLSKPATGNEVTEGRGILSYIRGWITYPFTWWSSGETEQPVTEPLLESTTNNPNDIVDVGSHKVTIWCNDQTCNTMKCGKTQCRNITCNIYDTDYRGECREYKLTGMTTETTPKEIIPSKPTEIYYNVTSLANNTQENDNNSKVDEHPLKLEAVLSSTINKLNLKKHSESKEDQTILKTQV